MTQQRLSKLQKWILQRTLEKTLLKDNSKLTILSGFKYEEKRGELRENIKEYDGEYFHYAFCFIKKIQEERI